MSDLASSFRLGFRARLLRSLVRLKAASPAGMAAFAKRHTAFYARFYEGRDPRDFESLPLVTKQLVRDISPYDLLARPLARKVVTYGETTGSMGSPTPSFFTRSEFRAATLLTRMSPHLPMILDGVKRNRTVVNGLAFGFTVAGPMFGDIMQNLGGLVANVGSRSTLATPPRIARGIARLRPALITATPIDFLGWMRILEEDHPAEAPAVRESLEGLLSTAELMAEERAKRIAEHFGIVAVDTYACVEGFFSLPCPCGEKHVVPAWHLELFDEDLNRIGTEGTGRLAFTSLVKRSCPMVRYLLDDLVTIAPSECPYGFRKSVFPHGRWELTVRLSGENVNVRHFENAIFAHGLFGDWHVRVRPEGLAVTLEDYAAPAGAGARVAAALGERFGVPASVDLVPFGTLTEYREPRRTKPIVKITDERPESTQEVPKLL